LLQTLATCLTYSGFIAGGVGNEMGFPRESSVSGSL